MNHSLTSLLRPLVQTALGLALLAPAAYAAQTQIAQVPLLNITGTGTVKPNLMLLFDNSGSMDQTYTPDYVNDALCRAGATLASGVAACNVGYPPFMSPDFNKQYYNPAIHYAVPIKSNGTYYPEQTAANTATWTSVSGDGFGAHKADLYGSTSSSNASAINLVSGFPDLKWCDPNNTANCGTNATTYTYPDSLYTKAVSIVTGPYYYTIGVAEYCTDATMTNCKSTSVGAAAPSGYPIPVKVRWCTNTNLTNCQGKRVGSYIYPRYSTSAASIAAYGTIAIGATKGTGSMSISSVAIAESGGTVTLTNGAVTASTGTNTALKQQTVASAVASSINNNTSAGAMRYLACVRSPTGVSNVPACSTLSISLLADNIVAVLAVNCSATPKNIVNCPVVADGSRAGWPFTVTTVPAAPVPATGLLTLGGATPNSGGLTSTVSWAGSAFVTISLSKNKGASAVVSDFVNGIGTTSYDVHAYPAGNSITDVCRLATGNTVCLVNVAATGNGQAPGATTVSGLSISATNSAGFIDAIPIVSSPMSSGSSPSTFVRVNIVSGQTYPKGSDRSDCVAQTGVCTYSEEMTNFANWYVYYKSRLQMMKTSVGIAFSAITANYKVGYVKLSNAGASAPMDMVPADFSGSARDSWYSLLYNTTTSGSTPIRSAMDNVGRMFANLTPYNYASGQEVVQFPCQQNFMILTTDGYWNGSSTANVVNNDNKEDAARFCTFARGCVDVRAQTQPSISDVALHWYNGGSSTSTVSLRPSLEPDMSKPGSVPAGSGENTHLHMNTYTLGLGVDGVMTYEPNYDTAPKPGGDFYNLITQAASGCPWNSSGAYVWPDPDTTNTASTVQERVDDLWHAAINGHGKYFSASQPKEVVDGLSEALANMQVRLGAAAAAATSTPNISQQDNDIFSDTFTTVKWYGELSDKKIDPSTGIVGNTAAWISSDTVGTKVASGTDTRTIYMLDTSTGGLKPFAYAGMSGTEKTWFDNKCSALAQCTLLSTADRVQANSGANLVGWLRGQQQYADDNVFRAYTLTDHTPQNAAGPIPIVLGDIDSSKPAYLRDPRKSYTTSGYSDYKAAKAGRAGTVFTAANDGMLHAFSAATGEELWAYVPRITMKKLYNLASTTYGTNHIFTTDGSPELADVQIGGVWKTVMVAGLNGGGRGYYALDVTDPSSPKALWELCADASVCTPNDPDLGLSFGNPQFGTWKGKWVVFLTSGYNNVPTSDGVSTGSGQGILYIVDVATGAILKKVSTLAGDTTTPSGLAKITSISADPNTDPMTTYIYGGDNQGQMWRFDLTDQAGGAVPVLKMGDAGAQQPVTTRPDVTLCAVTQTVTVAGLPTTTTTAQRVVLFGTGRLLDLPDTANTDIQSLYLLKDSGSAISNIRGSSMVEQTLSQSGSGSNISFGISSNPVDLSQKDGWFFDWKLHPGERMNLDPQIVSGVANVVTNLPTSSSSCSVGGSSNAYQVDICTGNAVPGYPAGTILSNTSAAVGFIIIRLPNGQLKMISTMATGETKTSSLQEGKSVDAHRVGWRRVKGE